MPTFPQWEATVLDHCYESVDYVSLHSTTRTTTTTCRRFLAASVGMDRYIRTVIATCDYVKAKRRQQDDHDLSFDEWNVWFHSRGGRREAGRPGRSALRCWRTSTRSRTRWWWARLLITLLRHADRVKIACLAQLVNVIAPIMTRNGGPAWRQTIYWPFYYASRHGRGTSMKVRVDVPSYECGDLGPVPYLDASAVVAEDRRSLSLFLVNRSREGMDLDLRAAGLEPATPIDQVELRHDDLKATNTAAAPDRVAPRKVAILGRAPARAPQPQPREVRGAGPSGMRGRSGCRSRSPEQRD